MKDVPKGDKWLHWIKPKLLNVLTPAIKTCEKWTYLSWAPERLRQNNKVASAC